MVPRMEAEAGAEILAGVITLGWGRNQIDVVKRAAAILGVPYHTYLKQVVFNRALEDIAHAEAVLDKAELAALDRRRKRSPRPRRPASSST